MTGFCGNPDHPSGPLHRAATPPRWWQLRKSWRFRRNVRAHGCGCGSGLRLFSGGELDAPEPANTRVESR